MSVDAIFDQIGHFGAAQKKYLTILTATVTMMASVATFNQQFTCWQPEFRCVSENGTGLENRCFNGTASSCSAILFDTNFTTTVTEWNLVCDLAWLPRLSQSALMLGLTVSALLSGPISDRIGRLRTISLLSLLCLPSVVAQAVAPSIYVYIVARFFNGATLMGCTLACVVLGQELVGGEFRALVGNLSSCTFAIGLVVLAVLARFCYHWRHLVAVTAVITAATPPLLWLCVLKFHISIEEARFCPESPRWLLLHGQTERASRIFFAIGHANGRLTQQHWPGLKRQINAASAAALGPSRKNEMAADECRGRRARSENIIDLLRLWRGCARVLLLALIWFSVNLSYYSLTAASSQVGGDRFANFALSGFAELPASVLVYFIIDRYGRCKSVSLSLIATMVCCLAMAVLRFNDNRHVIFESTLVWCAKLFSSAVFTMVYVHTLELFPTSVRNSGISVVNSVARLSGLAYPFMSTLDHTVPGLQYVVLSCLLLASSASVLPLPETSGAPLCATIEQMFGRSWRHDAAADANCSDDDDQPLIVANHGEEREESDAAGEAEEEFSPGRNRTVGLSIQ